ncbi:MAG: sugar kinase [Roseinatronobacter sp.]|nr:sugar kinase [Roseinatronobacter sp.]
MRIVSIGECMVELAPLSEPGIFRLGYAGDTFNTAWYLRRLLPPENVVAYFTAVGTDETSARLLASMAAAGIETRHIVQMPDRTVGLYLIELRNGERSFTYWRGQSAARTLAADPARLAQALSGARLAYLSGITLAILSPGDRASLLDVLRDFRASGGLVGFDPNLRPRLWPSPAEMCAAIMQAAGCSDIVLPSFEDEAAFFADTTPEATLTRYAGAGVADIVVKNGAGPMLARLGGQVVQLAPPPVAEVVDTTAAGDSFNAGFLAAHLTGAVPLAALAQGAQVAAQVIGARGALVDIPPADARLSAGI